LKSPPNDWHLIEPNGQRIALAVDKAKSGSYAVVTIALPPKIPRASPNDRQ
jgi:hypothetical protein